MSVGGTVHNKLKSQARKILIERGFSESEIEYEYRVTIGKKNYVVDVVGFRNGEPHIAIECGSVSNKDKLTQLKALFEVVEHIPYLDSAIVTQMNEYEDKIYAQERLIGELRRIISELVSKLEDKMGIEGPMIASSPTVKTYGAKLNVVDDQKPVESQILSKNEPEGFKEFLEHMRNLVRDPSYLKGYEEKMIIKMELDERIERKFRNVKEGLESLLHSSSRSQTTG